MERYQSLFHASFLFGRELRERGDVRGEGRGRIRIIRRRQGREGRISGGFCNSQLTHEEQEERRCVVWRRNKNTSH